MPMIPFIVRLPFIDLNSRKRVASEIAPKQSRLIVPLPVIATLPEQNDLSLALRERVRLPCWKLDTGYSVDAFAWQNQFNGRTIGFSFDRRRLIGPLNMTGAFSKAKCYAHPAKLWLISNRECLYNHPLEVPLSPGLRTTVDPILGAVEGDDDPRNLQQPATQESSDMPIFDEPLLGMLFLDMIGAKLVVDCVQKTVSMWIPKEKLRSRPGFWAGVFQRNHGISVDWTNQPQ